jgi:hypothetical protein
MRVHWVILRLLHFVSFFLIYLKENGVPVPRLHPPQPISSLAPSGTSQSNLSSNDLMAAIQDRNKGDSNVLALRHYDI